MYRRSRPGPASLLMLLPRHERARRGRRAGALGLRELRLVAAGRDPRDAGARPGPVPGGGPLCRAGLRPAGLPLWRPGLAAATAAPAERAPDRAAALRPVHGIPGVPLGEGNFPA